MQPLLRALRLEEWLYPPPHGTDTVSSWPCMRLSLVIVHVLHVKPIGEQVSVLAAVALESLTIDCIAEISDIRST